MVDGTNFYAYVNNNPVNSVDPRGLYTLIIHGRTRHEKGYSGGIGAALRGAGETVKETFWSGRMSDLSVFGQIANEIKRASEIAKSRNEPLNIVAHSWGGALSGYGLRSTGVKANWLTLGTPYFNFTRPKGVVRYANFMAVGDIVAPSSIFNLTAKQFGVINEGDDLFEIHNEYWNNPEVINLALKMFSLNKGEKK